MERTSRPSEFISSDQIERWRQLALEARTFASTAGFPAQICYLRIAMHWEALIEEIEVQRRAKGIVR